MSHSIPQIQGEKRRVAALHRRRHAEGTPREKYPALSASEVQSGPVQQRHHLGRIRVAVGVL